jgi:hypothetical protein
MANQHGILQIQRFHQLGEIIGIGVHIVTLPRLAGPPMTSAIMRDATVASAGQKEHLIFKRVRVQAIGVVEYNGLPFPPIFKIEFGAVSRGNGAHGITDGTAGALPNSLSPVVADGGGDRTTMTQRNTQVLINFLVHGNFTNARMSGSGRKADRQKADFGQVRLADIPTGRLTRFAPDN